MFQDPHYVDNEASLNSNWCWVIKCVLLVVIILFVSLH